jgi:hypothetical protein
MKYFGISVCLFGKSMDFHKINSDWKPKTEFSGMSGLCYWFENKKEAINQAIELIKQDFNPNSEDYFKFLEAD